VKRIPWMITAMMLTLVAHAFAEDSTGTGPGGKLAFQRYDLSYFERNDTGLTARTSYMVLTRRAQFDKIFGVAPTISQNHFLPDNTFKTKAIIATIARGHFLRRYNDPKVTAKNGAIYVSYTVKDMPQNSATFASPLILAVDEGPYSEVIFVQDGKRVAAATFPRTE
jgi:hypothetical protein